MGFVCGRKVKKGLVPELSGIMGVISGFENPKISESVQVSNTPTASESISESVIVTIT